uniref:NADH dehydrogenase subunit 6 n=1 Tax=Modiolus modulaides TaxID=2784319 RepID=UPI002237A751|nr:NADH dehydrogenase subunit 6 [Modiolus modulaides]UYA96806.1 NADH dehydrogenase subunit 6 [Modiolus modulaides]
MSLLFFCLVSVLLSMVVLSVTEPLFIGLILGLTSVFTCLSLGVSCGSLVGYFVFLIYVGGLMVLFGYVLSVYPNQKFSLGFVPFKGLLGLILFLGITSFKINGGFYQSMGFFLMFSSFAWIYLFVGGFLLFVLLLSVSLCKKRHMPLRGGGFGSS